MASFAAILIPTILHGRHFGSKRSLRRDKMAASEVGPTSRFQTLITIVYCYQINFGLDCYVPCKWTIFQDFLYIFYSSGLFREIMVNNFMNLVKCKSLIILITNQLIYTNGRLFIHKIHLIFIYLLTTNEPEFIKC